MPRVKTPAPRLFVKETGHYPFGPFVSETPEAALAAAAFAFNLTSYMNGAFDPDGQGRFDMVQEKQLTLAKKAGVTQGVISRVLNGETYPDIITISNIEKYIGWELWGTLEQRHNRLHGLNK